MTGQVNHEITRQARFLRVSSWRAASILNKDCHDQDRLALQFASETGQAKEWHLSRAADLLPHIAKALDLGRSIAANRPDQRSISETLERLLIGVAIVDGRGRVTFCNSEFKRHLEVASSVRLDGNGQLRVAVGEEDANLSQLFGGLWAHGRFGCRPRKEAIITAPKGDQQLMVEVMPLSSAPELDHSDAKGHIIYSIDVARGFSVDQERLKRLFGLTSAEAEVMTHLAEGLSNEKIAERRETSVLTTRTQLKSIFSKLDATNRVQAIRVAASVSNSFLSRNADKVA